MNQQTTQEQINFIKYMHESFKKNNLPVGFNFNSADETSRLMNHGRSQQVFLEVLQQNHGGMYFAGKFLNGVIEQENYNGGNATKAIGRVFLKGEVYSDVEKQNLVDVNPYEIHIVNLKKSGFGSLSIEESDGDLASHMKVIELQGEFSVSYNVFKDDKEMIGFREEFLYLEERKKQVKLQDTFNSSVAEIRENLDPDGRYCLQDMSLLVHKMYEEFLTKSN